MISTSSSAQNLLPDRQIKAGLGTASRRAGDLKHSSKVSKIQYKNNSYPGNKNAGYISF